MKNEELGIKNSHAASPHSSFLILRSSFFILSYVFIAKARWVPCPRWLMPNSAGASRAWAESLSLLAMRRRLAYHTQHLMQANPVSLQVFHGSASARRQRLARSG